MRAGAWPECSKGEVQQQHSWCLVCALICTWWPLFTLLALVPAPCSHSYAPSYSPSCLCNLIHAPTSSFMLHSPLSFILSQPHSYPHICPHMVQGHKLCLFILTLAHFYTCILTRIGIPSVELMSTWLFWLWHGLTCVFSFVSTLVYFGWLSCIIVWLV